MQSCSGYTFTINITSFYMPGGGGTGFVLRVKSDAQQASREISDASEPALRQQYIDLYMYSLITQTCSDAPRDCDVTISSAMFPGAAFSS